VLLNRCELAERPVGVEIGRERVLETEAPIAAHGEGFLSQTGAVSP
jgi:hypothetical protein